MRVAAAFVAAVVLVTGAQQLMGSDVDNQNAVTAVAQSVLVDEVPAGRPVLSAKSRDEIPAGRPVLSAKSRDEIPAARPVAPGKALVVMRVPRFGPGWKWVALEGTEDEIIADGPGHYPRTPLPGERGNVAFAAHRAGHGDPFIDFDRLRPGDEVSISQGKTTWTYSVDIGPKIIDVDDVWVLDPLPGRRLTLTTCWPKYGSERRMYVRASLDSVTSR